jgi:hypothetical protein
MSIKLIAIIAASIAVLGGGYFIYSELSSWHESHTKYPVALKMIADERAAKAQLVTNHKAIIKGMQAKLDALSKVSTELGDTRDELDKIAAQYATIRRNANARTAYDLNRCPEPEYSAERMRILRQEIDAYNAAAGEANAHLAR